jgi:hypothetical protein
MYSALHDRSQVGSSSVCGACHDVVSPVGGAIERTFYEWSHSAFGNTKGSTCAADGCHMTAIPESMPIASGTGFTAPNRTVHEHDFPAVDVALDPNFTRASVERGVVQQKLDAETLQGAVCVTAAGGIRVVLDPVSVGHQWPSGATQDRRVWVEVRAFKNGAPIYQSGVVPDGGTPTTVQNDPDLWLLRDCMFGVDGGQVDMFWQAASTEGNELAALNSFSGTNSGTYTHRVQLFPRTGNPLPMKPDDVQVRVWIQPVGLDVLGDLVDSGDLDAGVIASMPTFQVSLTGPTSTAPLEWTAATGTLGFQNDPYVRQHSVDLRRLDQRVQRIGAARDESHEVLAVILRDLAGECPDLGGTLPDAERWTPTNGGWSRAGKDWVVNVGASEEVLAEDFPAGVGAALPGLRFLSEVMYLSNPSTRRRRVWRSSEGWQARLHGRRVASFSTLTRTRSRRRRAVSVPACSVGYAHRNVCWEGPCPPTICGGANCSACPAGWQVPAGGQYDLCCRTGGTGETECFSQANSITASL